jgi:hypothetical protein
MRKLSHIKTQNTFSFKSETRFEAQNSFACPRASRSRELFAFAKEFSTAHDPNYSAGDP